MASKDYLVRQLETFMRALAQVISLRRSRMEAAATLVLDDLSAGFLGLSASDIAGLEYSSLLAHLDGPGGADVDRRLMAADVPHEKARLLEAGERAEEALAADVLSFRLLVDARERWGDAALGARRDRLDETARHIRRGELDRETLVLLWRHHLEVRRYGAAEDVLFRLLEAPPEGGGGDAGLVDEGIRVYEGLLGLPDAELAAGGLARDEVAEGLEELRRVRAAHLHPPRPPG